MILCFDLFIWMEAKSLYTLSPQAIANFLWQDIIYYHNCFGKLIINERYENKDAVAELTQRYRAKRVIVSAYQLQTNVMIECGHKLIIDTFFKISDGSFSN